MFVKPQEIVKNIGILPGMTVADFGSGSGHYALALAGAVGNDGLVYAIDVQKDMLDTLQSTAQINQIKNIEIIWADLDKERGSRLDGNIVDLVFISNILFQSEDRDQLVREARRIVKTGGIVAMIEWNKTGGKLGPSSQVRIGKEEAKALFVGHGFVLEREFPAGDNHYGLIFKKT